MKSILLSTGAVVGVLIAFALAVPAPTVSAEALHFGLAKSVPADSVTVQTAPTEVRLWFTEEPTDGTVSIRLIGAGDALMSTGPLMQDPEDAKVFSVAVRDPLKPGTYGVAWRGMGADGHVVQGRLTFFVAAP